MISSARRMVPGVLASLLLAAPLLAPVAHASEPPRKTVAPHARLKSASKHGQHLARRRSTTVPVAVHPVAFLDDSAAWHQNGIASWYGGPRWQGQRTASGSRYEQDALTAAHATLPLGSRIRVALEGSDRSVVVVITDRPGTRTRIIDLSRGAARVLGMLDRGVARVTLSMP